MTVDIIIASYNRIDMLEKCLQGIRENTEYPYRLILVDNGSDTEGREYIAAQDAYKVLRLDTNEGFARGYNAGLAQSDADYMVILNNDTIPARGWLTAMMAVKEGGLIMPYTNYACNPLITAKPDQKTETVRINGDVPAVCWMVTRECYQAVCGVMERIGGGRNFFHNEFEYGWAEDILTSRIIDKLGFKKYVAGGSYIHHAGFSTQAILPKESAGYRERNLRLLGECTERLNKGNML